MAIEASVTLRTEGLSSVGRERVRLLQAVAREGSISAGARAVGLTYKAAWDALEAMANLFGRPLLETRTGGRQGGGARLTPAGLRVIEAFGRLEAEMTRVLRALEPELAGSGVSPPNLVTGFLMRTSARNVLRGTITAIVADALQAEVALAVAGGITIHAHVTQESVRRLGLVAGREALALIKASFVAVAPGGSPPAVSTRNVIRGVVRRCETSTINAEVILDIGDGKTIAATITGQSAKALALQPGTPAFALFEAAHVVIAID